MFVPGVPVLTALCLAQHGAGLAAFGILFGICSLPGLAIFAWVSKDDDVDAGGWAP